MSILAPRRPLIDSAGPGAIGGGSQADGYTQGQVGFSLVVSLDVVVNPVHYGRRRFPIGVDQDGGKFVAPHPGHNIAGPQGAFQDGPTGLQQNIAGLVAQGVIDKLKLI